MCDKAKQLREIAEQMTRAAADLIKQADDLDWASDGLIDPPGLAQTA